MLNEQYWDSTKRQNDDNPDPSDSKYVENPDES